MFSITGSFSLKAQVSGADKIKDKVTSQNYTFKAQVVIPQIGSSRQLTDSYDLTITKDSIISYLPFFGQAYRPPVDATDNGIKFTSTKFEYLEEILKQNKGWQITIIPKDVMEVQKLFLTIFNNGSANLDVVSTNRQGISYTGFIK